MQFTTSTIIAILATFVVATPTGEPPKEPTSGGAQAQCGSGQKVSCCNSGVGNALLGASCVNLPISMLLRVRTNCLVTSVLITYLVNLIPISQQCQNDNVVACCNTNKQTESSSA